MPDGQELDVIVTGRSRTPDGHWWYECEAILPSRYMAYADEVHQMIMGWLKQVDEEELDKLTDARARLKVFPEYQTPGYLEEVDNLLDLPVWGLLIRPCMGHVHRHLGELEITKDILRKAISASALGG